MYLDVESLVLIAQVLKDERDDMASARLAKRLQAGDDTPISPEDSTSIAIELALEFLRSDYPEMSQNELQLNAKEVVVAMEKIDLDIEEARRAQAGKDEILDTRDGSFGTAMSLVSTSPPQAAFEGKGKGRESTPELVPSVDSDSSSSDPDTPSLPFSICGICFDPFKPTYLPFSASRTATSSSRLPFGLQLPCPSRHEYCLSCLTGHIRSKLDPRDDGRATADVSVFPVRCPECEVKEYEIGDDVANRVLGGKILSLWRHQKYLDSLPRFWCPHSHCCARLEVDENAPDPRARCPDCNGIFCIPCRSVWHEGVTCRDYQSLPLGDRQADDLSTLQSIKAKGWRRCPKCYYVVELSSGCNHMTCRCGTQFCFLCGVQWDTCQGRCPSEPACAFWNEDMLIDERDRPANSSSGSNPQFSREVFNGSVGQVARLIPAVSLVPPYVAEDSDEEEEEEEEEEREAVVVSGKCSVARQAEDMERSESVSVGRSEGTEDEEVNSQADEIVMEWSKDWSVRSNEGSEDLYLSEGDRKEPDRSDDEETPNTKAEWERELEMRRMLYVPGWRLDDVD